MSNIQDEAMSIIQSSEDQANNSVNSISTENVKDLVCTNVCDTNGDAHALNLSHSDEDTVDLTLSTMSNTQLNVVQEKVSNLAHCVAKSGGTVHVGVNLNLSQHINQSRNVNIYESNQYDLSHCNEAHVGEKVIKPDPDFHSTTFNAANHQSSVKSATPPLPRLLVFDSTSPNSVPAEKNLQEALPSEEKLTADAIEKVRRAIEQNREKDLDLPGFDISETEIPEVHPQIYRISFYEGRAIPKDNRYVPSSNRLKEVCFDKQIGFDDLVLKSRKTRFISLIGYPGSGKSTCSKRLAKKFSQYADYVSFRLKFLDMDYGDEKLTLKQLLLDNSNLLLSKEYMANAFKWIQKNQDRCLIMLDGYDQAKWTLQEIPAKQNYDTPLHIQDLIASLCCGHFLPNCHLIFTARPHAMLSVPHMFRPETTYLLQEFTSADMKALFYVLAGNEAERLWNILSTSAPQLVTMCHTPLILQLYIRAAINMSEDIGDITTMTRIFSTVLKNLRQSKHATHYDESQIFISSLASLAFQATMDGTVVISIDQLKKEKLSIEMVQDIIITLHGSQQSSCSLFEGKTRLYFCHQTFQEYFTALYIRNQLPLHKFKKFLKQKLFTEKWALVRQFLGGILVDVPISNGVLHSHHANIDLPIKLKLRSLSRQLLRQKQPDPLEMKRKIFLKVMEKSIKSEARLLNDHCTLVRECNDDAVTSRVARHIPEQTLMSGCNFTTSTAHAFSYVLRKVEHPIKKLDFSFCNLKSEAFLYLSEGINAMPATIEFLDLTFNYLSDVEMICSILHKIENKIEIVVAFDGGDANRRNATAQELATVQETLNKLKDTKLKILYEGLSFIQKQS